MTNSFETWIMRVFPGFTLDNVLDFGRCLHELDIMDEDHFRQALQDRYHDEAEAEYWERGEHERQMREERDRHFKDTAAEMNRIREAGL